MNALGLQWQPQDAQFGEADAWQREGLDGAQRATLFLRGCARARENFALKPGPRLRFGGFTLLHLLLQHEKCFLLLDEPWVDALLSAE